MASDDDQRAAAALNLASGGDPASQARLQKSKTRAMRVRIVVVLGSALIGVIIAEVFGHRGPSTSRGSVVAHWRTIAGPALLIAGLLLEIIVIVVRIRSGQFKAGWRSPSLVLSRGQRRRILRQIRGRAPVDDSMLPVARRLAELVRRQRSLAGLFLALPLVLIGNALPHNVPFQWWLAIILTGFYAVLVPQVLRDSARADRFLQQHPTDSTQPPLNQPGEGR